MDKLGSYSFEAGTRDKTLQGQRCSEVKDQASPEKQLCNQYSGSDVCSLLTLEFYPLLLRNKHTDFLK